MAGQIYNQSPYAFYYGVNIPNVPVADLPAGLASAWDDIFVLALDPTIIANLTVPTYLPPSQWLTTALETASLFGAAYSNGRWVATGDGVGNFVYNPATGRLGFAGPMLPSTLSALTPQTFTILQLNNGAPVTYTGADGKTHFQTTTVSWVDPSVIQSLFAVSQADPHLNRANWVIASVVPANLISMPVRFRWAIPTASSPVARPTRREGSAVMPIWPRLRRPERR